MTTRIIPIRRPRAHFNFEIESKGTRLRISLNWLTRFEYFLVDVSISGGETLLTGKGLHPGVDIFREIPNDIGKLYLRGDPATPFNLGQQNEIVLET